MSPDEETRIRHMIEAAETAVGFISGKSRSDLDDDQMLLFAIVRAVEVVGEAASRLAPETRRGIPDIPWRDVIGMRNRLVHAYFDINAEIVWKTATEELPELLPRLRALLAPE